MRKALLVAVLAVAAPCWAAASQPAAPKVLKAGKYQAKVTALACSACADEVEKTLKAFKGIDGATVEDKSSSVVFSVKKGAKVSVAKLQKALKAASDEMGMDADYRLKEITALKS